MKGMRFYKKVLTILSIMAIFSQYLHASTCDSTSLVLMEQTWKEFRAIHPFGFQTIGLKHKGDTCIFVISEPAEWVRTDDLVALFTKHDGHLIIGRKSFGYDGGLYDAIGCAILDTIEFKVFERNLFKLLFGSDYKPYYTNLNTPYEHVYYSTIKLDHYLPLFSWNDWEKTEKFIVPSQKDQSIDKLPLLKTDISSELYYSTKRGFVLWRINPIEISLADTLFRANARRFALDTDLIVHSFFKDKYLYVVGREREVPVTILPPLRCETICSIILNGRKEMAVIIKPDSLIDIKDSVNCDSVYWATPIMMSKLLWNTEMGNLMLLTDLMLKSWSENAVVKDLFIDYPPPPSFFTSNGVAQELNYEPMYFWEFLHGGRTGSLFPSYKNINDSLSGKAKDLNYKAYDYFAELNNTDLVRINQYVQILRPILLYPYLSPSMGPSFQKYDEQWIQSPSMTVSDNPWGYGGIIMQAPLVLRNVVSNLTKRGIRTPSNLGAILQHPNVRIAVQNEQLAWERVLLAKKALNQHNTTTTRLELKNANAAYIIAKNNLNSAFSPFMQHSISASSPYQRLGLQNNPRAMLINRSLGYSERGFVAEKHNVLPNSQQHDSKVDINEKQVEGTTSNWRERLQKKVFEKSKKINTIETKGNLYMIYGYILKFNNDGEYCINYAA